VLLLVATLLLSFTGYLLPWDQLSMWAVTVGTNMARSVPFMAQERPGYQVGEETLNLFYVLHCLAIPLAAGFLVGIHFWRVRKDGSISGPVDWSDL
jgi:quinol-cytochrome oxidoreductase complex cytochrome b subunit